MLQRDAKALQLCMHIWFRSGWARDSVQLIKPAAVSKTRPAVGLSSTQEHQTKNVLDMLYQ